MALITDKMTSKKLETRLLEFKEYGMTLYYLLEEGRTNFIYGKIMKHMKPSDLKKSYEKYSINYPNSDKIDEKEYKKNLNVIYTQKIIDLLINETNDKIDKTYINTYKHLLTNINK